MKTIIMFAAAMVAMVACAKPLKVLMIGNSFSVCVLKQLPQCAADAGCVIDIASLYIGGCPLKKHWSNVEKSGDANFRPYSFKYSYASVRDPKDAPVASLGPRTNIPQALKADRWDVVTIQQASPSSPFPKTYEPYAGKLIAVIREHAPQAEIVIQQTWSYTPYSKALAKWKFDTWTMFTEVESAYSELAKRYGLRIIPTGYAVELFRRRLPVKYGKILTDKEVGAIEKPGAVCFYGDVVGSSAWRKGYGRSEEDKIVRLRVDATHLNRDGEYLQACTWLATLCGYDVTKLKYAPEWLAPERAALMRACAAEAAAKEKEKKPLPAATFDSVAYGTHPRQVMDVWLPAKGGDSAPVIVFIHGGGFTGGDRKDERLGARIPKCLAAGVAMISLEYRLLKDAGDIKPPVRACMDDVVSAMKFIRSKAGEWNLDVTRTGLTGSSAGGCASLFAALTGDNMFGVRAVYVQYPQTSLDPKEMREWIPNSKYGANLFGYPDFNTWHDRRDEVLEWIEKFSAAGLLRKCTPSKAPKFFYSGPKAPPPGQLAKDPTHSGTFNDRFSEIAESRGISCSRGNHDSLLRELRKTAR